MMKFFVQYPDEYEPVTISGCDGVYMGVFGLSWKEKVAKEMYSVLKGTDYEGTIKDFWGGSGLNTGLVDTLHKVYKSYIKTGSPPPVFDGHIPDATATKMSYDMEDTTQIPYTVNMEFLRSLHTLASGGEIPFKYYDPVTFSEVKETASDFNFKDFFETASGKMNVFLIAGGVAAAFLMFTYMNKLSNR